MITVLDGGMSRELMRLGAPFRQPEWSALSLIESPDHVRRAHEAFARAGATVLTTNAYALVPFHLGDDRFVSDAARLAGLAVSTCRAVADEFGVRVAGCVPPPLGSYRWESWDATAARPILDVLVSAQADLVDLWLVETVSSVAEAEVAVAAVAASGSGRPMWLSFSPDEHDGTRLRSGESVGDAAAFAERSGAGAVLFNCSHTDVMVDSIRCASSACSLPVGVYPNLFDTVGDADANAGIHGVRADADADRYASWADDWVDAGATIIGGCCGVDSTHLARLSAHLAGR